VREKAKQICDLLDNEERLAEVRQVAKGTMNKYQGMGNDGVRQSTAAAFGGSGYGGNSGGGRYGTGYCRLYDVVGYDGVIETSRHTSQIWHDCLLCHIT